LVDEQAVPEDRGWTFGNIYDGARLTDLANRHS
jgi:hypothetical protein